MARLTIELTLLFAAITSFTNAAPHAAGRQSCNNRPTVGKAVYFITNEAENAVVALPIGRDGKISKGSKTNTGGSGSHSVDATGKPAMPDALVGQSALTVAGNVSHFLLTCMNSLTLTSDQHVFAVNAGSNTVTMMAINPADPTCLTMVGQPVSVPGEFPNTVAASTKNNLVCVGTTGAAAGVSCASFSNRGIGKMDGLRAFDLGQTTPPVGPLNTVSQTFFSEDGMMLYTTVKGDPPNNKTGFLSVFEVQRKGRQQSALATTDVRSSPNGTAVLFGSSLIPGSPSSIFVTDASFGATVLSIDDKSQATVQGSQSIDGQKATCWATVSDTTKTAFVTDVAKDRIVEMSLQDARIIKELDLSANGDPGMIDLQSAGNFVYALSPGNENVTSAITVLDVSGGPGSMKQAQHFKLDGFATSSAQGMAVLV